MKTIKKYSVSLIMLSIFEIIAITLWLSLNNIFYLFNFSYIGCSLALGLGLYIQQKPYARHVAQFLIGTYMLVYLGILSHENMQIEGFWYYLFLGVFEAATIHYVVAKIFGPLVFGRGWCGYACWSAMIFDLLPYHQPQEERKKIGFIRYIVFVLSLLFVGGLFIFHIPHKETIMFYSFIIGNIAYYIIGIALAFLLKDNRAFCKYICPITIFLKPMSYYSRLRIQVDQNKCVSCGKCLKVCPMNVEITNNSRQRKNGTECILCMTCVNQCPCKAIRL